MVREETELSYAINQLNIEMTECRKCPMVNHSQIYPGIYRGQFKYFFVGAAPWNLAGPEEAFMVGKASANFERFLQLANIARSECYVTNAVTHIPIEPTGASRQPETQEILNCSSYLKKQIDWLQPKLVIALGGIALQALSMVNPVTFKGLTNNIRKTHKWYGRTLMICTHPSPMAVSFRPEQQQIMDYEMVRLVGESL
jgi:DNA polymerase